MDISNWDMAKIMQLPDHLFGRRWPVLVSQLKAGIGNVYQISANALPERCVVWSVLMTARGAAATNINFSLVLADQLPADDTGFFANEDLFNEFSYLAAGEYSMPHTIGNGHIIIPLRTGIKTGGRRLCVRFRNNGTGTILGTAGIVVSSVPTEIPDWYFQRQA